MEQKRKLKKRNAYFFLSNVFSFKNNFLFKSSSIFSQMFLQLSIWLVKTQMKEINMTVLIVGSLGSNKILIYIFIYIYCTLIYNHRWDGCLLVQQTLTNLISIPSLQPGATVCVCYVYVKLWYRVLFLHIWDWSKPDIEPADLVLCWRTREMRIWSHN